MSLLNWNIIKSFIELKTFFIVFFIFILPGLSMSVSARNYSPLLAPLPAFTAKDIAIIVNESDALSRRIGDYYQIRRGIPETQVIRINFKPGVRTLSPENFINLKKYVDAQTPEHVQAFVLTWMQPYRVGCMSITTAFAAGFDEAFCAKGCESTRTNPYFNSSVSKPLSTASNNLPCKTSRQFFLFIFFSCSSRSSNSL